MERKKGEIFEYNGEWYQCVKSPDGSCKHCDMNFEGKCPIPIKECTESGRSDKSYVIFKKLEKVGEPYSCNYYGDNRLIMMQEYNLFNLDDVTNEDKIPMYITDYKHKRIAIEIKQNKEDMEEKKFYEETSKAIFKIALKYINGNITYDEFGEAMRNWINGSEKDKYILKEFDLEAAKAGKPVCTRDGHKARIICFDAKGRHQPIIALITQDDGIEYIETYYSDGRFNDDSNSQSDYDLMMLPEKKEGWVNVYYDNDASLHRGCRFIYDTKEQAVKEAGSAYITTVKINWEE